MEKSTVWIPKNYSSKLSLKETEIAIKKVKDFFEENLSKTLNLTSVSAPLFLDTASGLNDNLNGTERPVSFGVQGTQQKSTTKVVQFFGSLKGATR